MAHYYYINDLEGQLVDLVPLCSDTCHRSYCGANSLTYEGWNGCHELPTGQLCAQCGDYIHGAEHDPDTPVIYEAPCIECGHLVMTDEYTGGAPYFSSCSECGGQTSPLWRVSNEIHPALWQTI